MRIRIAKYASLLSRTGHMYSDQQLRGHGVRGGLQYYLLEIDRAPGITVQELARTGHFDNGSATRAAQRLAEKGYIAIVPDENDRRVKRIYTTDASKALVADARAAADRWQAIITQNMTDEEVRLGSELIRRMAENAYAYTQKTKEDSNFAEHKHNEPTECTGA